MIRAYRRVRAAVRRAIKPAALWINAWRYKQSEEDVLYLMSVRELAARRERDLRRKQVRLQMRRNEIAGW